MSQLVESEVMVLHEVATLSNFDIFLSHSGAQKPFVRELYKELGRVNQTRVFFDLDLPRGSHLATNILSAIQCCKVGVVVISQSFIKSLWPMMELQYLMMKQKESEENNKFSVIYPIFYEMQPGDLVKQCNMTQWKECWDQIDTASCPISVDIQTWPEALGKLGILDGTIITASSTSSEFLHEIVVKLCELLPQEKTAQLSTLECPVTMENLMELLNSCTSTLITLTLYWLSKFKINIDDTQALESPGLADIQASGALVDLSHHTKLKYLTLKGFSASILTNFVCKLCPPSLYELKLVGNGDLHENEVNLVIDITSLTSLWRLSIANYRYVRSLRGVSCPMSLKSLRIRNCPSLEELPDSNWLFEIQFDDCGQLKSLVHSQGKIIRHQIESVVSKKVKREFGVDQRFYMDSEIRVKREFGENQKGEPFYIDSDIRSGFPITMCFLDRH